MATPKRVLRGLYGLLVKREVRKFNLLLGLYHLPNHDRWNRGDTIFNECPIVRIHKVSHSLLN